MTDAAAIQATFADWRPVKSRGVLQLVLEVPVEQTKRVLDTLGAPIPGTEKWVGVALISPEAVVSTSASTNTGESPSKAADSAVPPHKQTALASGESKRERTLPERVWMRCNEGPFRVWIERQTGRDDIGELEAAVWVRRECGVESRKHIIPGTEAAKKWLALETRFLEDTGQFPERRR